MTAPIEAQIREILSTYEDPYLKTDLFSAKALRTLNFQQGTLFLEISLGFPARQYEIVLKKQLKTLLETLPEVHSVEIQVTWDIQAHSIQRGVKALPQVKNIIAVASGKGGVGKSTTALNLALAMVAEGAKVGLLDGDIYGPNQPAMLGTPHERPHSLDGQVLEPILHWGLQTMSIGYFVQEKTPMVWRGPMASGALQQLFQDTRWEDLDYLIVDMPPGTGDIQLTLAQKVPVAGAVIVTTPQDIALLDVKKALNMFSKVAIPTLGIVENMATFQCDHCGEVASIFGEGGAEALAKEFQVPLLGRIPLHQGLRESCDAGTPWMISHASHPIALQYLEMAREVLAGLSLRGKDYSSKFPHIRIQN